MNASFCVRVVVTMSVPAERREMSLLIHQDTSTVKAIAGSVFELALFGNQRYNRIEVHLSITSFELVS